jgi:hypothetical protein
MMILPVCVKIHVSLSGLEIDFAREDSFNVVGFFLT